MHGENKKPFYHKIIGIDLGTTNSCLAVKGTEGTDIKVIENDIGSLTTPSVVAFSDKDSRPVVGKAAKNQVEIYPDQVISSAKRWIGRKVEEVKDMLTKYPLPYSVVEGKSGECIIKYKNGTISPVEVSAHILRKIKSDAESYFGVEPNVYSFKAVITVPAYFNDAQRQATKDAGTAAGLEVVRIINEPTAAALAYGMEKKKSGYIAVYDLGGGTFDISILEISEGVFEVKATNGNTMLGGDDFDNRISKYLLDQFMRETGIDLRSNKYALQRVRTEAENAKIALSTMLEVEVNIPNIALEGTKPLHLRTTLTRAKFESLVEDLIDGTFQPCKDAMKDAGITKEQISEVIFVGGMTRMPKISEKVEEFFGKKPCKSINPDQAVAIGAAIQGAIIQGDVQGILLLDVTPLSLGIETMGGVFTKIIDRNTTIPAKKSQIFTTAVDNQNSVDIKVAQGDRPLFSDNKQITQFTLSGIPAAPRGVPQIEVTFDLDANGIMHVSAKDKATGKEQKIVVQTGGLSESELKKMQEDAEKFAEEDKKKRDLIDARNTAENAIYSTEKSMTTFGEKVKKEDKEKVEEAIKSLKEKMVSEDSEEIKNYTKKLNDLVGEISSEMYKNQEAPQEENTQEEQK